MISPNLTINNSIYWGPNKKQSGCCRINAEIMTWKLDLYKRRINLILMKSIDLIWNLQELRIKIYNWEEKLTQKFILAPKLLNWEIKFQPQMRISTEKTYKIRSFTRTMRLCSRKSMNYKVKFVNPKATFMTFN